MGSHQTGGGHRMVACVATEAAGLVERTAAPGDGRERLVALTEAIVEVARQVAAAGMPPLWQVVDRVSNEDLAALIQGLEAFLKAFREVRPGGRPP
ncbi:MAG: MarR family winged helix-turn-helix transcriptional regulator, partial [Propionibacteriaceae bacterium]|nr:MarR family winged helix-turn-helix transcriptional regulator [Propionibacteriaceae bacterium]